MIIRGSTPASCFGLGGTSENAATAALGWCLEQCPTLRKEVLRLLEAEEGLDLAIQCQGFGTDRGFTDLELLAGTSLHVIFEAKVGWQVPTLGQLERYLPRLLASNTAQKRLVSVSAADRAWAIRHLPSELGGVPISHLSWSDIQAAAARASSATRSPVDKLWLSQLIEHLKGYGMTSNVFDARAYVVSLNRSRISPEDPLTWVDVITEQQRYFHPIGTNGWPNIPPAYLGFRYHGAFQSVHFVESVITTDHIHEVDSRWPESEAPHFVYTLGPPMKPAKPLPLGKIHPSMRNWISLDLLLSGVAVDYLEAINMMKDRYPTVA